jgi:4,5-DOPA dioxygenase extradiol
MEPRMPALFIGHGDPMNALRDNAFTRSLTSLGEALQPRPRAVLVVSAHWLTKGTWVNQAGQPETIYDFGGFPDALYRVIYAAPGAPDLARKTAALDPRIGVTDQWGLDHGAWTVLKHLFPLADIPVFQVSIDYHQTLNYHFELARKIQSLRNEGVLIVGSGNIVHNLRLAFERGLDGAPYPWAVDFDLWVKEKLIGRDFDALLDYGKAGDAGRLSVPTVDHYVPLLYTLGVADSAEPLVFTYEEVLSSLSMRCLKIG